MRGFGLVLRPRRFGGPRCAAIAGGVLLAASAMAQAPSSPAAQPGPEPGGQTLPASPETQQATTPEQFEQTAGFTSPIWDRANLLGDPGGLRSALFNRGITLGLSETAEVFGNASGGIRRGAAFEGLLQMTLGVDAEKLLGLPGGTFNATAFQIHGRGLTQNNLGNLQTISSIEAQRGALLFELWYEQRLLADALSVRVGQMAADQEFIRSDYGGLFLNGTFGWPAIASATLPSGGPSYPLATPGVRVRLAPREDLAFLAAVFNGDPSGPGLGTPQERNPSGTAFRLRDGVFAIAEAQMTVGSKAGLPGAYKLGAYYNSNRGPRLQGEALDLALAETGGIGPGATRRNLWGIYAIGDQLVWRPADGRGGVGMFWRLAGAPGGRSLVSFYANAGLSWKAPFAGRENDSAGLAVSYARIGDRARGLDSDTAFLIGSYPRRRAETVLELTYQAQIAPWWQVQPDFQYVFDLGGGVPNPNRPGKRLGDAAVFGLRTNVAF